MSNYLGANVPEKEKQAQKQTSGRENDRFKQLENELAAIKEQLTIQNRDSLDAMYNIGMDNLDDGMKRLISETGNSIASIIVKTNENSASIKAFAEWKNGTGTDSLAGFVANATKDFATISMLAQYTTTDDVNGLISNAKAGIIAEARQGMATISMLASYTTTTDVNNLISSATAGIVAEAQEGMATVSMIANVTDSTTGKVTAASIVTAVNNDESSVVIKADKINLDGYVKFYSKDSAGNTSIRGSTITLTADKYGNSESEIEFMNYSSYYDDDFVMARILTRDNGASSPDEERRALVIKTNNPHFETNSREDVAFKVEAKGSISLESANGMIFAKSLRDILMMAPSGIIRLSPAYYSGDVSLNSGEYSFCADGIYYGSKKIVDNTKDVG